MFALPCSTRPGSRRASLRPMHPRLSLSCFKALALLCSPLLTARAHAQTTFDQTFTYTGNLQSFVVPDGVSSLFVRLWGAAGGGFITSSYVYSGSGAFVSGSLRVTPGSTLTLLVGGGGFYSTTGNNGGFGGGGTSGVLGGGGGGRSGILLGATELVDAAGGGGIGSGFGDTGSGGAGGVASGYDGDGNTMPAGAPGKGGTQTAGGAGGGNAGSGSQFQGGNGSKDGAGAGGGGGGGYFGGGGGAPFSFPNSIYGFYSGGGGGSSYTSDSLFTLTRGQDGSGGTPGGTGDPFYLDGVGSGIPVAGFNSFHGGNGEIVLSYTTVPEPGSVALLVGLGVTGAGFLRRKMRKA